MYLQINLIDGVFQGIRIIVVIIIILIIIIICETESHQETQVTRNKSSTVIHWGSIGTVFLGRDEIRKQLPGEGFILLLFIVVTAAFIFVPHAAGI